MADERGLAADVPAFEIEIHNVTNEQLMGLVDAGAWRQSEWWTPEEDIDGMDATAPSA